MPKIVDYPRAPLQRALQLAEVVDKLGGEASMDSAADHMGNKVGGAFKGLVGAATKFGLVTLTRGRIKTEPLFQDLKLAYNETQKQEALRRAFLNPPLFNSIASRLDGQPIPTHLDKLLIREYNVAEDLAGRLVGYFTDGARDAGIIGSGGIISMGSTATSAPSAGRTVEAVATDSLRASSEEPDRFEATGTVTNSNDYKVRITGPGMDSTIAIKDEDDLGIVEAMLKKVRRLLKAQEEAEGQA